MRIDPRIAMTLRQIMLMNLVFSAFKQLRPTANRYYAGVQLSQCRPRFHSAFKVMMAGPVTGLIVQPIIGALSDRNLVNGLGRRRPYFLIGAIGCSLCLFLFPHVTALWMAVLLLWMLDISNNTAMEPYCKAFIADTYRNASSPPVF